MKNGKSSTPSSCAVPSRVPPPALPSPYPVSTTSTGDQRGTAPYPFLSASPASSWSSPPSLLFKQNDAVWSLNENNGAPSPPPFGNHRSPDRDRSDSGKLELDRAAAQEEARFNALSTSDKALDWASRHQYSIILGSWALSMVAAGAIVAKDK